MGFSFNRKRFKDLSEQEVLALAISSEEDDARIYRDYAERLRADYPDSAAVFDGMATEEDEHRRLLIALHRDRFGEVIPLIRREHVSGYYARRPVWLVKNLSLERSQSVRQSFLDYCKKRQFTIDESQFLAVGLGISTPKFNPPRTKEEWAANRRVVFRIKQVEAELTEFTPLN